MRHTFTRVGALLLAQGLWAGALAADTVSPERPHDAAELAQIPTDAPPITLGSPITGALADGDTTLESGELVDFYLYQGHAGEEVHISLDSTDFDTYLMVRSDFGFSADNDDINMSRGLINSAVNATLPTDGAYYIGATSYQPGMRGSYTLRIDSASTAPEQVTEPPPPVTPPTALVIDTPVTGRLEAGDLALGGGEWADMYAFQGQAGSQVSISLESAEFDTFVQISGPQGMRLANDDDIAGNTNSRLQVTLPEAGEYQIMVTSYAAGMQGAYTLVARNAPGAPPQGDPAVVVGDTVSGALGDGDRTLDSGEFFDGYMFRGVTGQRLEVDMSASAFDPYLIIRGPDNFQVDNDDQETGNLNARIISTLPASGIYIIGATSALPGERGDYQLVLSEGGPVVLTQQSITPGQTVTATLSESDPVRGGGQFFRSYTFDAQAGQRALIDLTSAAFDTYLVLRMPNGGEEVNDDIDFQGGNTNSHLDVALPVAGTYEIQASSYWTSHTGDFTLTLALPGAPVVVPPVTQTSGLSFDAPLSGRLEATDSTLESGEYTDTYTFSGTPGEGLTITLESNEFDTYLLTRGPSGEGDDNDDAPGLGTNSQLELTPAGTEVYNIGVTSYRPGEMGAYTLTLTRGTSLSRSARGRIFGIFAGVTDYMIAPDLSYCAEDATQLRDVLNATGLLAPESVLLTNAQATRAAIQDAFARVAPLVGPDDLFIFFFSGHGSQMTPPTGSTEPDGREETLVAADEEEISDDELAFWMETLNGRLAVVALDSCFSGGFARDVVNRPKVMGLFSSEEDVVSNVAQRFEAGGYLSYFLRQGFGGAADTDPADGYITVGELTQYLRRQWAENVLSLSASTAEDARTYQNLVVERGGVKVTDILLYQAQ